MSIDTFAPLELGKTDDNSTGAYDKMLGMEHEFPGPYGGTVRCMLVENASGIALSPKREVVFGTGKTNQEISSYVYLNAVRAAGIVDPEVSSVPNGHVFWIVRKGLTVGYTAYAADATNVFAENTPFVSATAATSQAASAGLLAAPTFAGATAVLAAQLVAIQGRALSAKTTANTVAELLVDVDFSR